MRRRPDQERRLNAAINAAVVGVLALVPALQAMDAGEGGEAVADAAPASATCAVPGSAVDPGSAQAPDLPVVWQIVAGYAATGAARGSSEPGAPVTRPDRPRTYGLVSHGPDPGAPGASVQHTEAEVGLEGGAASCPP
jgi:hypothetical protein